MWLAVVGRRHHICFIWELILSSATQCWNMVEFREHTSFLWLLWTCGQFLLESIWSFHRLHTRPGAGLHQRAFNSQRPQRAEQSQSPGSNPAAKGLWGRCTLSARSVFKSLSDYDFSSWPTSKNFYCRIWMDNVTNNHVMTLAFSFIAFFQG